MTDAILICLYKTSIQILSLTPHLFKSLNDTNYYTVLTCNVPTWLPPKDGFASLIIWSVSKSLRNRSTKKALGWVDTTSNSMFTTSFDLHFWAVPSQVLHQKWFIKNIYGDKDVKKKVFNNKIKKSAYESENN